MEHSTIPQRISRVLHWVGDLTARSGLAAVVTIVVVACAITLSVAGFPGHWEEAFSTAATSITLVMLFVIQHTQSRQQVATQLKLDELIRTSPDADDLLVKIEKAPDEELIEREQDHLSHHEALRDGEREN
ncbi:MAG: low affinity iron permease family protein [Acidimicrobiales bacterium]|jgi:low affinity Fe/Cu permease